MAKAYEGFEKFMNSLRMRAKMIRTLYLIVFLIYLAVVGYFFYKTFSVKLCLYYLLARALIFLRLPHHTFSFSLNGETYSVTPVEFANWFDERILPAIKVFLAKALVFFSLLPFAVFVAIIPFYYLGKKLEERKRLRGSGLISAKELSRLIKKRKEEKTKTSIKLTKNVSVPISYFCSHAAILGTTGVGKSTLIKQLLDQIRRKSPDDICIVFDIKGEYLSAFYDPDRDIVFNPLDVRCVQWNLFKDIRERLEINDIARAFIPSREGHNSYFYNAGKDVFASILEILWEKKKMEL